MNRELMKNTIQMLIDLGDTVYQQNLEMQFLEVSADFYRVDSQGLIDYCNCCDYLKKVEGYLSEEKERVSNYLDVKTEAKIINVVEQEVIANAHHKSRLVNSGLVSMILYENDQEKG